MKHQTQQQLSPLASCQVVQQQQQQQQQTSQQQEMHNMGYSSLTPQSMASTVNLGHVHSNQSCPPGSVEAMDPSSQAPLESPRSAASSGSVEHISHSAQSSVESYHHHHQHHHQQMHQQSVYDSCSGGRLSVAHSPLVMNPPTPQPIHGNLSKPPTPQQSSKK